MENLLNENLFTAPQGTTFEKTDGGTVIITRSDQPLCEIPIADLESFLNHK